MSLERHSNEEPTPEVRHFIDELHAIATEEGVPGGSIDERGFRLAATFLEQMRQEHGDKPHHNHMHGLNTTRCFWAQWRPLWEKLPDRFDVEGFELGMLATAGHDIINELGAPPGENERASAELVYNMMLEANYEEPAAQRVYNAIIKTTTETDEEGVIVQTQMRTGQKDILGLNVGWADMNAILLMGPDVIFRDAPALHQEYALESDLAEFLRDEDAYLRHRIAALRGDLQYYVEDEAERDIIKRVYWDEFRDPSLSAVKATKRLYDNPEQTRRLVNNSIRATKNIAYQGLGRLIAMQRHMADHFKRNSHDKDSESN
jgi:hypothetical protein